MDPETQDYPGQRLGLPERGPGSVASWPRRLLGIAIDWGASWLVALALFPGVFTDGRSTVADLLIVPAIAVGETALFTAFLGGSFGHVICRTGVARLDGRPLGFLRPLVRAVLVYLVIPPLVYNRDNRGLHDLAAGTVLLQR